MVNSVGDYVIYNGKLYHCTAATSGAFDSSDWEMVLVDGEFKRVDANVDGLKNNLKDMFWSTIDLSSSLENGYYYTTNVSTGSAVSTTKGTSTGFTCGLFPCKKGDIFTLTGKGGSSPRTWAFTDTEYKLISNAAGNAIVNSLPLTAPSDGFLFFNSGTGNHPEVLYTAYLYTAPDMIGKEFDETQAYSAGEYTIHGSELHIIKAPHEAGEWNKNEADVINFADELRAYQGSIENVTILGSAHVYPTGGTLTSDSKATMIYTESVPGRRYIISKEAGKRFSTFFTNEIPANGVAYYSGKGDNKARAIVSNAAPSGTRYFCAYVHNTAADTDITAETMIASVTVNSLDSFEAIRNRMSDVESYCIGDINNKNLWEFGSIGSDGDNYERDYEIRTRGYIDISAIQKITFTEAVNVRLACYSDDDVNGFIYRYQLNSRTADVLIEKIVASYPETKYIRFSIYTDTTPVDNLENYSKAKIVAVLPQENNQQLRSVGTILYPDMIQLHKEDKPKARVLRVQRTSNEQFASAALKLLFFTDVHNEIGRVRRAVELMNDWGSGFFDVAVNGGDTTSTIFDTEELSNYDAQIDNSNIPVLNTIGNHDAYSTLSGARPLVAQTTIYNAITEKVASNVPAIVQPENAAANGLNYYYWDKGSIRIVVLDCMYWDSDELSWFETVLADSVTNEKAIIAVAHYNFVSTEVEYVENCIWNPKSYGVGGSSSYPLPITAAEAVKTFQDNGGEFIIWLCGHSHGDSIKKLKSEYGNQFQLICSSFVNRAGTVFKSTDPYEYNYDCLTYIVVDTYYKIVRGMRIGANINEEGAEYHTFAINYGTGTFLSAT